MNWECVITYNFQRVQELFPVNLNLREQFARCFMNKNIEDNDFHHQLFTDETTFLRGCVFNTQLTHVADLYEVFLKQVLPELLDDVPLCIRRQMWFQQDGAPAHTSGMYDNF